MKNNLEDRLNRAVEQLQPGLEDRGLKLGIVEISYRAVQLRLCSSGDADTITLLLMTLPQEIEEAITAAVPDLREVVIEWLHVPRALGPGDQAAPLHRQAAE